jgi:cytoskeleton protein RodZ
MSEVTDQMAKGNPMDAESGQATAGEMLRQAREAAGLQIPALAVALKVSAKKIEALEADRLDLLPDAVFIRALASSVCRALKIDPAPVLGRLPKTAVPRLEFDGVGLNTPFQTPGDVSGVSIWNQLSRPVVLAALALLAGALVLIFFPSADRMPASVATTSEVATPAPTPAPVDDATPAAAPAATVVAAVPSKRSAAPELPPKPAPAIAGNPPSKATAAQPAASSSGVVTTPIQGRSTRSGVIVFRTSGPSWVEVTDAQGGIQIRRTISEGEVVGVSGPLPLSVVIGRADITEVEVRGKPFALPAFTRENVARFEVK